MAPSHLSGMEMRSLLFGVLFGLLAVVHSTPVTTVTQDEVYREVVTDGYIIASHALSSLTTESPKRNTTVPASQQPASEYEESEPDVSGESMTALSLPTTLLPRVTDDSTNTVLLGHEGEHHAIITPSVSHAQSSTVLPLNTRDFISILSTQTPDGSGDEPTQTPDETPDGSGDEPTQTPDETPDGSGDEPTQTLDGSGDEGSGETSPVFQESESRNFRAENLEDVSTTTTKGTSTAYPTIPLKDPETEGSGSGNVTVENNVYPTTTKGTSTTSPTFPLKDPETEESGSGNFTAVNGDIKEGMVKGIKGTTDLLAGHQPSGRVVDTATQSQGHTTPGWIIIVGFIVGLAALVMLCAAIATRDKWNGPKQASQVGTNANSSNQQRELEMETFLHNDNPRENGKAADYTVVPLDDVPENYSSH